MTDLVRAILGPGGPIASTLGEGFESRPEQLRLADAIARTMDRRSHLIAEAGTGVGKSYAYLVPAILRALAGQIVVIATNTIALQEQLVERDIPLLRAALESHEPATDSPIPPSLRHDVARSLRPVLVKGRGNYLSIRRLKLASQRQDRLLADAAARRSLHVIEDWAYTTTDGTLSTLPPLERPGIWDKVQSDSGNCMGRKCPTYDQCFYQTARRQMDAANLLICNHALFFSELALRAQGHGFMPDYHHVVIDEAHAAEDVAAEHFGLSLAEGRVIHLLSTLYHARTAKGYIPQLQLITGDASLTDALIRDVLRAENATRAFFDALLRWAGGSSPFDPAHTPDRTASTRRIRAPGIVENTLTPAMAELASRLKTARDAIKSEADRFELNAYAQRAQEIAADAQALIDQSMPGSAYWLEVAGSESDGPRRTPRLTLACSPVDVAPLLREHLFVPDRSVVLTSATLATAGEDSGNDPFEHAARRLGCPAAETLLLGSPFEYARQVRVIVDRSMPRPAAPTRQPRPSRPLASADDLDQRDPADHPAPARPTAPRHHSDPSQQYHHALCARILDHVRATEGGAFVLFTSFATLAAVARDIEAPLAELGYPLLVQGKTGPRNALLDQFKRDPRSVLLGAASFWQGVDVKGHALRNVIITRLPFEPPDRPLTEARLELITARGGDPFTEDSLPRAVIRFKQGFGRLIRSKTDSGRVVVLDPRVLTTGYGKRFLDALPHGVRIETDWD